MSTSQGDRRHRCLGRIPAGLIAAVGLVGLLSGCAAMAGGLDSGDVAVEDTSFPPVQPDDLPADDEDAVELTEALLGGRYADVAAEFNEPMREAVSERELKQTTERVLTTLGGVTTIGRPGSVVHGGGLVFLVPVSLAEGFAHVRITFDGEGRIAGLYLLR